MTHLSPPIALSAWLIAVPVTAEAASCFGRVYSPQHLAAHPGQQVREIRAMLRKNSDGDPALAFDSIDIRILFRGDAREYIAWPACYRENGALKCASDCDGGAVFPALTKDGSLRLTTEHLSGEIMQPVVEESCSAGSTITRDIAEKKGETHLRTVFVLPPLTAAQCNWEAPW